MKGPRRTTAPSNPLLSAHEGPSTAIGAQRNREVANADLNRPPHPLMGQRPEEGSYQGGELLRVQAAPGERTWSRSLADAPGHKWVIPGQRLCLVPRGPHCTKPLPHYKLYSLAKWFPYTAVFNPSCTSELPREHLKILMPRHHPILIKLDSLGTVPRLQYYLKLPMWSLCAAKMENHCMGVTVPLQLFSASTFLFSILLYFLISSSLFYSLLSVDNSMILH